MCSRSRCATEVLVLVLAVMASPSKADPYRFFNDPTLKLWVNDPPGVIEPAVPIYYDGTLIQGHNHQVIEAYDRVPGTDSDPLTLVDLAANTYLRLTYQKADGTSGTLGTSIVGSPSFRTSQGLQFIPTVTRSDVSTSGGQRYENVITANFGSAATVTSSRTFPDPIIGRSTVNLSIGFQAQEDIDLAAGAPYVDNDRLRVLTVSSMFASSSQFDANILRYETRDGGVMEILLTDATPRGQHLLPNAEEIGDWLEVIQGPGSTWSPDSPSIRVDILDKGGRALAVQGFLDSSTDPSTDSLSIYLEVLGAGDTLPAGTQIDVSFRITAVPEPSTLWLLSLGVLCLLPAARRPW
jgi:hypothetical protein